MRARTRGGRGQVTPFTFDRRSSGLLLHVTSLPGPHGSGDLSDDAIRFVDFCADAGQTWWQMLPVGPPGAPPFNSPYSSSSSAAGSPYLVSLEGLERDGLLEKRELRPEPGMRDDRVNFGPVRLYREARLRLAYDRFRGGGGGRKVRDAFEVFVREQHDWVNDFALFCALKERLNDTPWYEWEPGLRTRKTRALAQAAEALAEEVGFHKFVQFAFDRQWQALRGYARSRGVGLIGDVPIFVTHDSVDVWCNPRLFRLDASGRPTHVTGVPPDAFSDDGQRWGHPQYDWAAHRREKFRWWIDRFARTFRLFDAVRIDHFLGFNRVWSIPARSPTARNGTWVKSPGHDLFDALRAALGDRPVIAEDLGVLVPEAAALRDAFGFPGMRVFQFGFGEGSGSYHKPHGYVRRSVAYTGTHDNDTTMGWLAKLRPVAERHKVLDYAGHDGNGGAGGVTPLALIRSVMASVADTAIFPVQDLLALGSDARMNTPGRPTGNWHWRLPRGALTKKLTSELRRMTALYDRQTR